MASVQCHKPAEHTCNQGLQQDHSLGQKVSEIVTSVFKKEQTHQCNCQTQCVSQTTEHKTLQTHSSGQTLSLGTTKTHTNGQGLATTNGAKFHGRRNGEHRRRSLLQKIKDGISGHSDSGSSSSSESDSDDEKCGRKKN